jgi:hypothetical protein
VRLLSIAKQTEFRRVRIHIESSARLMLNTTLQVGPLPINAIFRKGPHRSLFLMSPLALRPEPAAATGH